jgi:hypothetical protein
LGIAMNVTRLALAAGLLFSIALPAAALPAHNANRESHLYVVADDSRGNSGLYRYPLVNGIPRPTSDLVYLGIDLSGSIGPNGDVYAAHTVIGGVGAAIDVFAAGTMELKRRLFLPPNGQPGQIVVDVPGFLYVVWCRPDGETGTVCYLLRYPPGAHGHPTHVSRIQGAYSGLALDDGGGLYAARVVGRYRWEVQFLDRPETSLRASRTFSGPALLNGNIGLDAEGLLHIVELNPSAGSQFLESYVARSSGRVMPTSAVTLGSQALAYGLIAIGHGIAYLPLQSNNTVVGYALDRAGGRLLFRLPAINPRAVAFGR